MIDIHHCFQFSEIETTDKTVTAKWSVPQDLPYLQGHFPGQPIVPAVAMLDASVELFRVALRAKHELTEVKNAKFTKPLEPFQTVTITCQKVADGEWNADWKIGPETIAKIYFAI